MTLQTNLATRPFYNVRAVHAALWLAAILVLGFTAFNVIQLVRLRASQGELGAHAAESEAQAQKLRAEAARIRTQIDQKELEAVAAAAREANAIIDRRAFSWTDLLTQLEATLPANVRITSLQPRFDQGATRIGMVAEARRTEDVSDFIEALEGTGAFRNVVPLQQNVDDEGLISIALDSLYTPPAREGSPPPAAVQPGAAHE